MIAKTKAIILRNTNYSESSIISKMYTREFGVRSYILQSVRKGKSAVKPSMVQPLSIVQMDVYEKPNMSLGRVKELKNTPLLINIQDNMLRKSIAMFYLEVINLCITEELCEEELFDFLEHKILTLENSPNITLLPQRFLLELSAFLGVSPQGSYTAQTPYLSINEGVFVPLEGSDTFNTQESELISSLIQGKELEKSNASLRKNVLQLLIRYYQHHVIKNKQIKSVDILAELLG
ncbi:MAG: recombination protein O N-terminal domain-containing protein [Bacteroidia bacterium]|jgi:DNA repair protein RecO (recombination protein O)|nr:recombination protein O N-terminal domain-containing protein [Bacteroidia bacterium]